MDIAFTMFLADYEFGDSFIEFLKEHFSYEDVYTVTYADKATQTDKQFFWSYFK